MSKLLSIANTSGCYPVGRQIGGVLTRAMINKIIGSALMASASPMGIVYKDIKESIEGDDVPYRQSFGHNDQHVIVIVPDDKPSTLLIDTLTRGIKTIDYAVLHQVVENLLYACGSSQMAVIYEIVKNLDIKTHRKFFRALVAFAGFSGGDGEHSVADIAEMMICINASIQISNSVRSAFDHKVHDLPRPTATIMASSMVLTYTSYVSNSFRVNPLADSILADKKTLGRISEDSKNKAPWIDAMIKETTALL